MQFPAGRGDVPYLCRARLADSVGDVKNTSAHPDRSSLSRRRDRRKGNPHRDTPPPPADSADFAAWRGTWLISSALAVVVCLSQWAAVNMSQPPVDAPQGP